jgi:hypothetical protein
MNRFTVLVDAVRRVILRDGEIVRLTSKSYHLNRLSDGGILKGL